MAGHLYGLNLDEIVLYVVVILHSLLLQLYDISGLQENFVLVAWWSKSMLAIVLHFAGKYGD